jgi:hypothetical protein
MRLVVQVETVADELFELDFRRPFRPAAIETAAVATVSPLTTVSAAITAFAMRRRTRRARRTVATRAATGRTPTFPGGPPAFPRGTDFLALLLLLCHVLNLSH